MVDRLRAIPAERLHLRLMLVLTFTTGINDAVGYLGLDKVFTGNMTGNVVVLGMALAGGSALPVLGPALALVGFMAGAAIAGRVLKRSDPPWGRHTTIMFSVVAFIMLAEVLIFVPYIANMRVRWLSDRLNTAAAAAVVADGFPQQDLSRALQDETLMATGTKAIVLRRHDASRLIAIADMPPKVDAQYDLAAVEPVSAIRDAFDTLIFGGDRIVRAYGPISRPTSLAV